MQCEDRKTYKVKDKIWLLSVFQRKERSFTLLIPVLENNSQNEDKDPNRIIGSKTKWVERGSEDNPPRGHPSHATVRGIDHRKLHPRPMTLLPLNMVTDRKAASSSSKYLEGKKLEWLHVIVHITTALGHKSHEFQIYALSKILCSVKNSPIQDRSDITPLDEQHVKLQGSSAREDKSPSTSSSPATSATATISETNRPTDDIYEHSESLWRNLLVHSVHITLREKHTMDHLLYDLVEEVVNYLPRDDVKTIAKVAATSRSLKNWSIAAEDHLENRFLLDVHASVLDLDPDEEEVLPFTVLSVKKGLPYDRSKEWDFTGWRYAWIRNITIETTIHHRPFERADMQKVLRVASLPVDPSARGLLKVEHNVDASEDDVSEPESYDSYDLLRVGNQAVGLSWEILRVTQKEFVNVHLQGSYEGVEGDFAEFAAGCVEKGMFLEKFCCIDTYEPLGKIFRAAAPLFGRRRRTPLKFELSQASFESADLDAIIDRWWNSDGTWGQIEMMWWLREDPEFDVRPTYIIGGERIPFVETPIGAYVAHPTRRSTLAIDMEHVRLVRFQPWHIPVDFEWMDSVIEKWKQGNGFFVCRGARDFVLDFKAPEDLQKVEEKYGPWEKKKDYWAIHIAHPSNLLSLELSKNDERVSVGLGMSIEHEIYSAQKMRSLIARWRRGNGETLINGLTAIEIGAHPLKVLEDGGWDGWKKYPVVSYSHPRANARCLVARKKISTHFDREGVFQFCYHVERVWIAPIDPEDVNDWNLELLFGPLRL
uniref:F-box domain-containing protein n=1 Tax=Steinernema glaseri TaxID=37863 RepID=A0A1I7ZTH5_9BILA